MGLNIKKPRTTALVRELAERTGTTETEAVEMAVRECLARLDAIAAGNDEALDERRRASAHILKRIRTGVTLPDVLAVHAADWELFDDLGLPK